MKTVVAGKPIIVMDGKFHKGFGYGKGFKERRGVLKCRVALKTTQKEHEVNASYVCKRRDVLMATTDTIKKGHRAVRWDSRNGHKFHECGTICVVGAKGKGDTIAWDDGTVEANVVAFGQYVPYQMFAVVGDRLVEVRF